MKSIAAASSTTDLHTTPERALPALRAATHARHIRIDTLMDLSRMGTPEHYARVLQVLDAFLGPWEDAVAAALPVARRAWLRQRSRRAFLRQDLRTLQLQPLSGDVPRLPLRSQAAAWGSLYVIEGSALGGQAIIRALASRGLRPEAGGAYFHGWGPATGRMWREFLRLMETELAQPADVAAACTGACLTFDALSALLEAHLHERIALA